MKKIVFTILFLSIFLCGCTTSIPQDENLGEGIPECKILNKQIKNFNFRIYKIECPENVYRCFHGYYSFNCFKIEE